MMEKDDIKKDISILDEEQNVMSNNNTILNLKQESIENTNIEFKTNIQDDNNIKELLEQHPKTDYANNKTHHSSNHHPNKFDIDFDCCSNLHEMNRQLEKEEEYNEKSRKAPTRKARVLIFKKEIQNDQLIKLYKTITNNLIKVNLNNINEIDLNEFKDYHKLIQTHMELTKLLFNLTSPIELLSINRNFIYKILANKIDFEDVSSQSATVTTKLHHGTGEKSKLSKEVLSNLLFSSNNSSSQKEAGDNNNPSGINLNEVQPSTSKDSYHKDLTLSYEQNSNYLSHYVDDFKNIFIKNDYFMELSTSLIKIIEFYTHLIEISSLKLTGQIKETNLNSFKSIILNDLILSLCLLRNICLEKNDSKFTLIVCRLFDFKMESILISLCNLKKINKNLLNDKKYDNISFVILSLLFQIFSLLFSKLNSINNKNRNEINQQEKQPQNVTTTNTTTPASTTAIPSETPQNESELSNSKSKMAKVSINESKYMSNKINDNSITTEACLTKTPTLVSPAKSSADKTKSSATPGKIHQVGSNGSSSSSFKSSDYTKKSIADKHSNKSTEDSESLIERSLEKTLKQGEDIVKEHECKYKLNKLGVNLCKSGAFAYLIDAMVKLLNKNLDINDYFDISYFFWFIKFVIKNFLMKNLEIDEHFKKYKNDRNTSNSYKSFILNNFLNARGKPQKSILLDTSFLNDSKSKSATKTRKTLLSYDLLAFVCFKMLNSFERLIFDSNKKNMERLEKHRLKQLAQRHYHSGFNPNSTSSKFEYEFGNRSKANDPSQSKNIHASTSPPLKVANINYLRVLFLSLTCLYELLDCIRNHLSYLNSSRSNFYFKIREKDSSKETTDNISTNKVKKYEYVTNYYEFIAYMNEFLSFEQLKQSFCMFMRFYCYNEHLYTRELIKYILLTNQLFLNTYENVYEFIKQIKLIKELEKDYHHDDSVDTGSGHDGKGSTISSIIMKKPASYSFRKIYDLYANSDTSFIIKYVLSQFIYNDPILNRCVIDLLDSLMTKSHKREYIFHMNLALSLANIAMLENFRELDQRTKDLVANMLNEIRNLCHNKPDLANKILFDVHRSKSANNIFNNLSNLSNRKRNISKVYNNNENKNKRNFSLSKKPRLDTTTSSENLNESLRYSSSSSSGTRSMTRSLSSSSCLDMASSASPSSSISSLRSTSPSHGENNLSSSLSSIKNQNSGNSNNSIESKNKNESTHLSKELKLIIENEFLFCLFSLDAFDGQTSDNFHFDQARIFRFLTNSDHLYRIFNYLIRLFESYNRIKLTSWQIYNCLLNMKFDMNDKINYIREMNEYKKTGKFCYGLNIGFSKLKDDFFRSNECINLRIVCSTSEFRELVRKTYIKYLIEKLCIKSKQIRSAIFWLHNRLRIVKSFHNYKYPHEVLTKISSSSNSKQQPQHFRYSTSNPASDLLSSNPSSLARQPTSSPSTSTCIFEYKLLNFYHINKIGIPFIPFAFELQQVFHSIDFSRLLDLLGIVTSNNSFPYLPVDWLDSNSTKLNDCLIIIEKCLGI